MRSVNPEAIWSLEEPFVSYIAELWQNSGIQSAYRRRREFQLTDSANLYFCSLKNLVFPPLSFVFCSFLTELHRLSKENYVPANEDILRVQDETTEIVEYQFLYNELNFWYLFSVKINFITSAYQNTNIYTSVSSLHSQHTVSFVCNYL